MTLKWINFSENLSLERKISIEFLGIRSKNLFVALFVQMFGSLSFRFSEPVARAKTQK